MTGRSGRLRAAMAWTCLALWGCEGVVGEPGQGTSPGSGLPSQALLAPPRAGFEEVAKAIQPRCGTLDCHGQWGRNLRLFGGRGLRLDPKDTAAEGTSTHEEVDATYWSVVALEPEILSAVVAEQGRGPERLTLFRKARDTEKHKGGVCTVSGDNLDRCLQSWLVGRIDVPACKLSADFLRPGAVPAD